jgi:hypothetical protein
VVAAYIAEPQLVEFPDAVMQLVCVVLNLPSR